VKTQRSTIPLVLASIAVPLVWGPHARSQQERPLDLAMKVIKKHTDVPLDVLKRERNLLVALVDDKDEKGLVDSEDKQQFKSLTEKKEIGKDELEPVLASAWVELRLGGKEDMKEKAHRPQDFTLGMDDMVRLTVETTPPKAKVYLRVEDNYVGNSTVRRWVFPGRLRVVITKDGFEDSDETIEVPMENHVYKKGLTKK
jgi:hypothetical protein